MLAYGLTTTVPQPHFCMHWRVQGSLLPPVQYPCCTFAVPYNDTAVLWTLESSVSCSNTESHVPQLITYSECETLL